VPLPPSFQVWRYYIVNIKRLIASDCWTKWTLAEHFLRRREVSLLRRLDAAVTPYKRKRLLVQLDRIYWWQGCVSENYGNMYSASAARCAAASNYRFAKAEWEARTGERWYD